MLAKRSHTWSAALIVFLWVGAPLLSLVHVAHQSHSYCVEHRRLEEAPHGAAVGGQADAASRGSQALAAGGGAKHSSPAHEECSFGESFTRDAASHDVVLVALRAPALVAEVAPLPKTIAESSIPLLLTAPKSSPPRLA